MGELSAIIGMLSAMRWNDCPRSIGIPVRNRRNPHLGEQIGCDHSANARLRRTPRFVQDIATLLQFKSLQLSRSHDRACDIEFPTHWAKNAHAVDCRPDSFRNGTADGAVHVLAPLVAKGQPTTVRCLLLHAVRHLHPGGGRIKRLLGYAAGGSGHANSSIHTNWSVRT